MSTVLRSVSAASAGVSYLLFRFYGLPRMIFALVAVVGVLICAVLVEVLRTRDPSFLLRLAVRRYILSWLIYIKGYLVARQVAHISKNLQQSQAETLTKILRTNGGTLYSKEHGLDKITTREELREIHPLSGYGRFEAYYERMMNGEENVLTAEKPLGYGITSGTTGRPSKIAVLPVTMDSVTMILQTFAVYKCAKKIPEMWGTKRKMLLYYYPEGSVKRTPDGSRIGPFSGLIFKLLFSDEVFTSPLVAFDIPDETSTRYIHILFGLYYRDLTMIDSTFVSIVYMALRDMENHWEELVEDVRCGTLKKDLRISEQHRAELIKHLRPNPERADELEREFRKGMDNITQRIWPNLRTIYSICTGSFTHYKLILQEKLAKDARYFHFFYASTEAALGVNLWPDRDPAVFLLFPINVFYEFIPAEQVTDPNPQTVYLEQLETGKEYEIVLTTFSGLYRYRLGDVVKVVDFYNQCPIVQVLHRTGQLLSIKGEKVSEPSLYSAINKTLAELRDVVQSLTDFTSCESVFLDHLQSKRAATGTSDVTLQHYVVFLELELSRQEADCRRLETQLSEKLDKHLREVHGRYEAQRVKEGLAPLEVILVRDGTFRRLRDLILRTTTASMQQMKIPRVLKKPELVKFMLEQRQC